MNDVWVYLTGEVYLLVMSYLEQIAEIKDRLIGEIEIEQR